MFGSGRASGSGGRGVAAFAGLLAMASAGCVKGAGEPCERNADCEPGLSCYENKCVTCGDDGTACLAFDLVTRSCEAAFEPLAGDSVSLEFTLKVAGEPDQVKTANLGDGSLDSLPNVPPGKDARLIVTAKSGDTVIARGSSATFQVDLGEIGPAATVFMRKTNEFTPATAAADPATCSTLTEGRAGHTMTLLADGRVLVAGGYRVEDNQKVPIKSVELYDARTGVFAAGGVTAMQQARWGHTATRLPDGRVLLVGGTGKINGQDQHLVTAELFDPTKWGQTNAFASVRLEGRRGRMNHAAALLPEEGVVVISGGYASVSDSAPQDVVEVFDPARSTTATYVPLDAASADVTLSANRAYHRMVPIGNGQLAVIGGRGDAAPLADTDVLQVLNGTWSVKAAVSQFKLRKAREFPIALPFGGSADLGVLVLGKPSDASQAPADVWEWVKVGETAAPDRDASTPPIYRKDACAALFDSGSVQGALVVGGRDLGSGSVLLASADVVTLQTEPRKFVSTRPGQIQGARALAACVTLADGSVLVTGGIAKVSNADEAQKRAEIFQP